MTFGFGLGLTKGGGAGGLPAFAANFIGGSLPTGSTFSRGTIGTLYNQSGLVAYAPSNLNLQSGFASGYSATRSTGTINNTVSPDGSINGYRLIEDTTPTATHYVQNFSSITITNAVAYSVSVYAKANGRTWIAMSGDILSGFLGGPQYFDIGNGVIGTLASGVTSAAIQYVGNGWYRCSYVATSSGVSASFGIFIATGQGGNSYTGDGLSGVFLYGAQVEQGSNATTYTPTTSAAVYGPRFDFDPNNVLQQNLLLVSNTFTNANWAATTCTVTPNATTGPFGANDATALVSQLSGSRIVQTLTVGAASAYTYSIYVKAGTQTTSPSAVTILLYDFTASATLTSANVNLTNGAIQVGTPTVTAIGNGWYQLSITATTSGTNHSVGVYAYAGLSSSVAGDTVYVYGAQVNIGSTALPYLATTSTAQTVCAPKGLLIEETRTNSLVQSEDFNTTWTTLSSTVATNSTTAPDGNTTADKVTSLAATAVTAVQQVLTGTAVAWTSSVYAKANGAQYLQLLWQTPINATDYANFDLLGGTVTAGTNTSSSIQYVGNGWYRCTITSTLIAAAGTVLIYMVDTSGATRGATFTGNGTKGIYLWGAQLEAGAFATSYIPTTSATVTRNFDSLRITSIPWFNASAGTFVAQADNLSLALANQAICAFSAGAVYSTGNGFLLRKSTTTVDTGGNTSALAATGTVTANVPYKAASTYQGVNMAVTLNGGTPNTATTNDFTGSGTTTLVLGALTTAFVQGMSGHIQSFSYYNYALTNAQLQQVTT